jgi:hypothetical protein
MRSPPSRTMRIFSSAEKWRRVSRRMSFTTRSAGAFAGTDFCLICAPERAKMNQKLSLQKTPRFVPWALTPDTPRVLPPTQISSTSTCSFGRPPRNGPGPSASCPRAVCAGCQRRVHIASPHVAAETSPPTSPSTVIGRTQKAPRKPCWPRPVALPLISLTAYIGFFRTA